MASLKEKTALITGASSGVGRAIALELAALGALVLLVARTPQKLEAVAAEIRNNGGEARTFAADLTDDTALRKLSDEIKKQLGRLDFLIHSAGIFRAAPFVSARLDDFDAVMRCNVRAPFALTQALAREVIAASGAVAFINSTAGEKTHANVSQYAASKHALKALADTLRIEINPHHVRVLSVMLGRTATPMQEEVCRLEGSVYEPSKFLQPPDVARAVVGALTIPSRAEVTNLYLQHTPA
ncbi:MAG TPA: SDR family NAD(P)-dependent oxidoreductase [Candidatus Limnocylindria bacterium]|nr:SDR family NAD(P)-dependent oxidoreductase [Candidatus Limnocylindria bacterium]